MIQLDSTDIEIIRILQEDAKRNVKEIAADLKDVKNAHL